MIADLSLIDSNILVYAHQPHEPHFQAAQDLVTALGRSGHGKISVQNLAEFCNVFIHKRRSGAVEIDCQEAIGLFSELFEILTYDSNCIRKALDYVRDYQTPFYDALLAATMLENGIDTIYTENTKDFERIPGIKAVNPFA